MDTRIKSDKLMKELIKKIREDNIQLSDDIMELVEEFEIKYYGEKKENREQD